MTTILQAGLGDGKEPVRLLLASIGSTMASQRKAIAEAVQSGAGRQAEGDLVTEVFESSEYAIAPCRGCTDYCDVNLECVYQDGMQAFRARWLQADAVVWITEATHAAEAVLRAIVDRMNQVRFATHFGRGGGRMPRYLKAVGLLTPGESPDRCFTVTQFLRHANLQYQSLLVTPPMAGFRGWGSITLGEGGGVPVGVLDFSRATGRRVVEVGRVLQDGLEREAGSLPDEYFPSRTTFGELGPIQERR
jgi:multimeric flavodoxin WrbA